MEGQGQTLNLQTPEQSITTLSFCESSAKDLSAWVEQLPMANIGETAKRLYHAIIELNQLITAPANRLQLLETIRTPLHFVCRELSKHYLNQAIVLPEKQRKIANLSQALQVHLATGYKIALMDCYHAGGADKHKKLMAQAAHRVTTELGYTVLRACQLYCASPDRVWNELHQIFCYADNNNMRSVQVRDEENSKHIDTNLDAPYKKVLLLGCCKPNQLRQNDLGQVYNIFEYWVDYVEIGSEHASSGLFVINMQKDSPPIYRSLVHEPITENFYGLDTSELVHRTTEYLASINKKGEDPDQYLTMPTRLNENLIAHLGQALGILTKRTFKRIAGHGLVELCVGLSATHYFCAGQVEFARFMFRENEDDDENKFVNAANKRNDAWGQAFDASPSNSLGPTDSPISFKNSYFGGKAGEEENKKQAYQSYKVPLVNTSPGGYCLQWSGEIPGNIQAGEVLGIRESNTHPWSIAAIRWIRQIKQQGTQLGIELLAPSARPCGVQLLQKTGDNSEFLRGLLLPELTAIGQPASLITPRLPFQVGQKVMVSEESYTEKCQLIRRIAATGSINQFELKYQSPLSVSTDTGSPIKKVEEDDFDSLWPSL
jgi:hypothetical protein